MKICGEQHISKRNIFETYPCCRSPLWVQAFFNCVFVGGSGTNDFWHDIFSSFNKFLSFSNSKTRTGYRNNTWLAYLLEGPRKVLKSGGGGGGKELINVVGIISPRPSWDRVTDLQKLEGAVSPSLRPLRQTRYWNMFKISRIRVSTFAYKWVLFSFPLRDHSITTCTRWGRGGWKILQIRKYFCLDYCLFLVEIIELQS